MKPESRLDYATFQLDEARTRCELWVTAGNETEKLASGSLKPFLTHLRAAQEQNVLGQRAIRLQVPSAGSTLWFTKGTIERFVRFVTTPDVLERVSIVETERRQLEEAINILAAGDQQSKHATGATALETEDLIDEEAAGDSSKNQLLVAMDARRIMLHKEQLSAFSRAAAAGFDAACMNDLVEFSEFFGAVRLREACLKFTSVFKKMQEKGQLSELEIDNLTDSGEDATLKAGRTWSAQDKDQLQVDYVSESRDGGSVHSGQHHETVTSGSQGFRALPDSPPVIAGGDSPATEEINSQQGTPSSRRLPRRVSSPRRRSCSPMRRVQIARSGSRRQGMVVVRNINYASPSGAKIPQLSPDGNDNSSEESDSLVEGEDNKEEQHRRLSVQDAINLFERKQRDSLESQSSKVERRASTDTGSSGKSVLRRWSSTGENSVAADQGAGNCTEDVSMPAKQVNDSAGQGGAQEQLPSASQNEKSSISGIEERRKSWLTAQKDLEWKFQQLKMQEAALPAVRSSKDLVQNTPQQPAAANMQFGFQYRAQKSSRAPVSRSWSATSEQDLLSLVGEAESNATDVPTVVSHGHQREQGRFYEQYRERRDARIRQESDLKRAEKESKLKAMQEMLDRRKAELVAGGGRASEKSTERQAAKVAAPKKGMVSGGRTSSGSRSSPTVSSLQTTPRVTRQQQLPPEPRPRAARKLSPGRQKPVVGPSARNLTASPKLPRSGIASGPQRRPSGMPDNPLSRSMPSLSELRKENTRPAVRTSQAIQQSRLTPPKSTKPGGNLSRQRAGNKVLPLESNGVVPSDTPPKRKLLITSTNGDSQILTPLKLLQAQQQSISRIPAPKPVTAQETKAYLRKGRGIGPGAGPGVMKLKVASMSDQEEEDKAQVGDNSSEAREFSLLPMTEFPLAEAAPLSPSVQQDEVPGSVRESQEMDIDTSSIEGDIQTGANVSFTMVSQGEHANDNPVNNEIDTAGTVIKTSSMEFTAKDAEASTDVSPLTRSRLTLMQQIATEEYVSLSDRDFPGQSVASRPTAAVPLLRSSTSPELDGVKTEKSQRKKWGSSQQKTIPVVTIQPQGCKDGPKGFKRLLKFGRKSRGSGSSTITEWVSASTTSEGEDSDVCAGYGNGTSFLRRSMESYSKEPDHVVNGNGSRSFFSLSTFRSKGSDSRSRC